MIPVLGVDGPRQFKVRHFVDSFGFKIVEEL